MFIINMFVLQIYQQNSYSCWLKQNQWLLTDRQTTVVLTIASLTVGTTWEQNQTRVNTPCTILQNDRNSMQVTRQHMVARQHWNQINAWKIHKLIINENYQFKYKRKLKLLMIIIYTDGKLQTHIYHKNYFQWVKSLNQWSMKWIQGFDPS